jgi:hypothetical protein
MMETHMQTDAAAPAAVIPGLVVRPYAGVADVEAMVRIRNADWEANGVPGRWSVDEAVPYLAHPSEQFDPARDAFIA